MLPGREQLAYSDQELPVSDGADRRFMVAPMVLARHDPVARIKPGDKVLDVACGRGYSSAILSELGAEVTALEADPALADAARTALAAAGFAGVSVQSGASGGRFCGFVLRRDFDQRLGGGEADRSARAAERWRAPGLYRGSWPFRASHAIRKGRRWMGRTQPVRRRCAGSFGFSGKTRVCVLIPR